MCASEASNRGPISALQEFVQEEGKLFRMPANCSVLQWEFTTRMAGSCLEFRATVAFMLAAVPHHVAGVWMPSKKRAQRDAAERALGMYAKPGREGPVFLPRQGEKGSSSGTSTPRTTDSPTPKVDWATPPRAGSICWADCTDLELDQQSEDGLQSEVSLLRTHCFKQGSPPPVWSCQLDDARGCRAFVEIKVLGVWHTFSGQWCPDEETAEVDVAKRVLWYLQAPGLEDMFEPDFDHARAAAQEIPGPATTSWCKDSASEGEAQQQAKQLAERKTTMMRVQNRLQQAYARQLEAGTSVWHWSVLRDKKDKHWPPRCRAVVAVPLAGRSFSSDWTRGQKEAQIDACMRLLEFLDVEFPRVRS
mmetsp:Transcript_41419/g.118773  ORF Transcript_41419/g.118773 Transcript_41419/m.118773 type:complete len:362 (-) Transcript_41419:17-1102(-)